MVHPLHIKNAHIWDAQETTLRGLFTTNKVVDKPAAGALEIDLDGYTIFPGLINAHDHLELNHYPRSKFRDKYDNAHQWGEDMNVRLDSEPYKSLRAYPLWDKLFIGGLKNLLCGATTVVHHNPPHKDLWHKDFPVRVLRKYGWTHSLYFSTDEEIIRSYNSTPSDTPWFIHLAEGTDAAATEECERLKLLGCIQQNTVLIHGVGLIDSFDEQIHTCLGMVAGLVWCPSTNAYLLNETADIHWWLKEDLFVCLGSDSRLTADGDLLDEMRAALKYIHSDSLIDMVTIAAAVIINIEGVGDLQNDFHADWVATKSKSSNPELDLCQSHRADIALIVKGGVPQIGDPDIMAKFPHIETIDATLDGKPKRIQRDLARRIHKCALQEPGLEVDQLPSRKLFRFI